MFTELVICALVTWQAVEIYHHSTLFASVRARLDLVDGLLGDLHRCPWCLSVWVGMIAVAAYRLCLADHGYFQPHVIPQLVSTFGMGLAVSRLSNVCNDLLYNYSRTPQPSIPKFVAGPPTEDTDL